MAYVSVEVDVDLEEFSDDEIKEEYEARHLGTNYKEIYQRAYMLYHQGRKDEAHAILWDLCLDKVNRVI